MALMEQIRNSTQSGLSYILVGVLIVFFAVFFGVPADGCTAGGGRILMASVHGDDIHTEDVNVIYNRYFGGQRTIDDDQRFNQQAEALKVVITTHLLAERAREAGLRVSDEEFVEYLMDANRNVEFLSSYGSTGEFDGSFYERYVQNGLRVPINRYEDFKRKELLARKYLSMLDMQINVTPDEIDELNRLRNTKVNLEFVKFSEELLTDAVGITDEAVEAFLADNQDRVREYYEENQSDYESEERLQIRRVYIVKPSEDTDAEEAQRNYEQARNRIMEDGEDFATVAQELSEDFARDDGGLMDWNSPDNMDQAVAQALADAEPGDLREVETDFAYMLLRLEDREPAEVTPLEEVQDEIARSMIREDVVSTRGGELAAALHARVTEGLSMQDALDAVEEEAREEERPEDAALWASLSPQTTGLFTLEGQQIPAQLRAQFGGAGFGRDWDDIPRLGQNRELAIAAFQLTPENPLIDEVVEFDDSRAVVRLAEREDPPEELSASERAEMELEVRSEKIMELLGPWRFLFFRPMEDVGHYVESVFQEGMKDGSVRLYERKSRASALLREMTRAAEGMPIDGLTGETPDIEAQTINVDDL